MKPQRPARLRAALVAAPITALALVLAACGGPAAAEDPAPSPEPTAAETAAPEPTGPIVVEHVQGTVELDDVPQTVFSFDWGVTQVLLELGVPVTGVPSRNQTPPPFADLVAGEDVLDIGTLFEPDFELIAASAPDLIVIAQRSAPQHDELSRIAPTIDLTVDTADNIDASKAQALTLGAIFGLEAEAQALVDDLAASIEDVKEAVADAGDALIILTTGGGITAFGPGGRFGLIHDELGFTAAAAIEHDGRHGQAISFEFLLETEPEWLFVIDRDSAIQNDGEAARAVLDNGIVRRTQAYQNNRIVYVDTTAWYMAGTGVVSLQQVMDGLLEIIENGHA